LGFEGVSPMVKLIKRKEEGEHDVGFLVVIGLLMGFMKD